MTEAGTGQVIYELRKKIQKLTLELTNLSGESSEIPELIKSANLLRSNEHLLEIKSKQNEMISVYAEYSKELEQMLEMVFEIQRDLKEILKTQIGLISEDKKPKKAIKSKKKSTKK